MKKTFSVNFAVQIATAILWALTFSGLQIDPAQTAADLVQTVVQQNWFELVSILVLNTGNAIYHWVQTLRENPKNFWSFLHSLNWWLTFGNVVASAFTLFGFNIPTDAVAAVVQMAWEHKWVEAAGATIFNILLPLIKRTVPKPPAAVLVVPSSPQRPGLATPGIGGEDA